ncbi:MAG TPA: histidine phosphatase family protein [Acidimicrobiales bacterium]
MLILVRHGRTDLNARGLLQGRLDPSLDAVGYAQAAELAKVVGRPDRVISSPLVRARETAAVFGCPVEVDERWIELDYGELDGLPVASVGADVWARWRSDLTFTPVGGESIQLMVQRVVEACHDLVGAAADQDVVVVSHVSPIKAAVTWALGVGAETGWRTHLDAASITRVDCRPTGPVLRTFNETGHLSEVLGPVRITG